MVPSTYCAKVVIVANVAANHSHVAVSLLAAKRSSSPDRRRTWEKTHQPPILGIARRTDSVAQEDRNPSAKPPSSFEAWSGNNTADADPSRGSCSFTIERQSAATSHGTGHRCIKWICQKSATNQTEPIPPLTTGRESANTPHQYNLEVVSDRRGLCRTDAIPNQKQSAITSPSQAQTYPCRRPTFATQFPSSTWWQLFGGHD